MVRHSERGLAIAGALVFVGFGLGCMSLSFGGKTEVVSHEEVGGLERGNIRVAPGQESVVYYPNAYVSPPNLELDDPSAPSGTPSAPKCQIVDQRADSFRVRNTSSGVIDVVWKSRGVKMTTATTVVAVPAPATGVQQTGAVTPPSP